MEQLFRDLATILPDDRLIRDPLRLLAYGTDASFYRLTPKVVAELATESEVKELLAVCRRHKVPVTFRAAGTSLSGQAVGEGVLAMLGDGWRGARIESEGAKIRLQPGVIGAEANRLLTSFGRKIGPDPASIDSCRIGGIAANNASGMCCGTADNSYQTLDSMRLILADGTLVDTGDRESRAAFQASHGDMLERLAEMGRRVRAEEELSARIRRKFAIKNTTGYSLNALLDYSDPIDILSHLMIGSEGTLGFIAEVTYRTVPDHAFRASALLLFPGVAEACRAVARLRRSPVAAVELMDRAALRSVEDKPGMPSEIRGLAEGAAALLVEVRGEDHAQLTNRIAETKSALEGFHTLAEPRFTDDPVESGRLWKVRKGLFPAVGAVRRTGTTVIIEDVAFPLDRLADAILDLTDLCTRHGYGETIIFGHALDGNLHFVFTQDFGTAAEISRYAGFMDELSHLVVGKYDGSLKAEHGTGRNMAPFVEMEWGARATALMWEIKHLLDPEHLLNPGVLLDRNPHAHLENLKPLPAADPLVDRCIECGFCERMCPSHGLTLSPRQRITAFRELSRLRAAGTDRKRRRELEALYDYQGIDTCAACGLCATVCPVGIDTGRLTKSLRGRRGGTLRHVLGSLAARHYGLLLAATRIGLSAAGLVPRLSRRVPTAARPPRQRPAQGEKIVYFPTCSTRSMGPDRGDPEQEPLPSVMMRLLERAGFQPILPDGLSGLCCGQPFESKGLEGVADAKAAELEAALRRASENGKLPIVMDASTCSARMKTFLGDRLVIEDSLECLHDRVLPRLTIRRQTAPVVLHLNCGARKMGLDAKLAALARASAESVTIPEGITCCGFAGDKGFTTPELNDHALRRLAAQIPADAEAGYCSNRTCEIGLAGHSGIPYRGIAYLLERASRGDGD